MEQIVIEEEEEEEEEDQELFDEMQKVEEQAGSSNNEDILSNAEFEKGEEKATPWREMECKTQTGTAKNVAI